MNFLTLKKIAIVTKQTALKILEIEKQYREAIRKLEIEDKFIEEVTSNGEQEDK